MRHIEKITSNHLWKTSLMQHVRQRPAKPTTISQKHRYSLMKSNSPTQTHTTHRIAHIERPIKHIVHKKASTGWCRTGATSPRAGSQSVTAGYTRLSLRRRWMLRIMEGYTIKEPKVSPYHGESLSVIAAARFVYRGRDAVLGDVFRFDSFLGVFGGSFSEIYCFELFLVDMMRC